LIATKEFMQRVEPMALPFFNSEIVEYDMNNELTKKDIEYMEKEIEHRKVVVRKELLEHVKEARAQGDLSENFEYYAAKKAKNQNESRIRFLERMIKTARVIDEDAEDDEVGMNKTVTLKMEYDGSLETYKIITTMRKNSLKGLISIESPLGKQ
jgi:transcription elongation factor GreA